MNGTLLALTGVMAGAIALNAVAADPAVPHQWKMGQELHAAVTDMPEIIDMSHADPKAWHGLPRAGQVYWLKKWDFQVPSAAEPVRSKSCVDLAAGIILQ